MDVKCPICGYGINEADLPEHMRVNHPNVEDPEVAELAERTEFPCPICHVRLPSPEAVKDHIAAAHHQ